MQVRATVFAIVVVLALGLVVENVVVLSCVA